jgi:hypothetical protein
MTFLFYFVFLVSFFVFVSFYFFIHCISSFLFLCSFFFLMYCIVLGFLDCLHCTALHCIDWMEGDIIDGRMDGWMDGCRYGVTKCNERTGQVKTGPDRNRDCVWDCLLTVNIRFPILTRPSRPRPRPCPRCVFAFLYCTPRYDTFNTLIILHLHLSKLFF